MFRLGPYHKTGDILNEQQRRSAAIAGFNEVGHLLGRFRVDDAAKAWWATARWTNHAAIVRNHADLYAANSRMSRNHFLRVVSLEFIEMSFVQQTFEQMPCVVRLLVICGYDLVKLISGARCFHGRQDWDRANRRHRWFRYKFADS